MKYLVPIAFSIFLIACVEKAEPPSDKEIELLFESNRTTFIKLRDQIRQDLGEKDILQVGSNLNREAEVSDQQLANYIVELEKISVERLTAYKSELSNVETSFLLESSGLVFVGCSSEIVHHQKGKPFLREWANPYNLIDLKGGWYAHTLCN